MKRATYVLIEAEQFQPDEEPWPEGVRQIEREPHEWTWRIDGMQFIVYPGWWLVRIKSKVRDQALVLDDAAFNELITLAGNVPMAQRGRERPETSEFDTDTVTRDELPKTRGRRRR